MSEEENELSRINEGITDITTIGSLDTIQRLNLHSNLLTGLKGLMRSSTITELNLSSNRFEDSSDFMELSQLPNLKSLDLSGNSIRSFNSFPYMPSMESFSIAFNELQSLEGLDCFPCLISLDLRGNLLSNVISFSIIETLSMLKDIEISSEDGRHSNPICQFKGDVLQIFDFSYFGRIDHKFRQEWVDFIHPQPQKMLVRDSIAPATATPRVDAMIEKYRRGMLQTETKKPQDILIYESGDDDSDSLPIPRNRLDKDRSRGIVHPVPVGVIPRPEREGNEINPWNQTFGVISTLAQRSDLIRKQLNHHGERPLKNQIRAPQFDQMSDTTPSDVTGDWIAQPLTVLPSHPSTTQSHQLYPPLSLPPELPSSAPLSNPILHKNLLQLSISLLKVWNRFHSVKLLRSFWFRWKSFLLHENDSSHLTEMTVENNLLRSTISLLKQKNEEKEHEKKIENELLVTEIKNKLIREHSERSHIHEKILDSKNKEYQQLSKIYNELERKLEEEKGLREREQVSRLKEKEIQENEIILLTETRARELNEMKKEMREREMRYEEELRRQNEESEEKRRQYERLIQLLEDEIKVRREEWKEREKDREKERERDRERIREKEIDMEREREKERERVEDMKERVIQYKEKMTEIEKKLEEKEEEIHRERNEQKKHEKILKRYQEISEKKSKENQDLLQKVASLTQKREEDEEKIGTLREILERITTRCKEQEKKIKKLENQSQFTQLISPSEEKKEKGEREREKEREEERRNYENELNDWKEKYEDIEREYQNHLEQTEREKKETELTLQIKEQMIRHQETLVEDMREKKKKDEIEFEERREREREREKEELRHMKEKYYEIENELTEEREENKEIKRRYKGRIQELEERHEEEIENKEREITQLKKLLEQKERDIELIQSELIDITKRIQNDRNALTQKEEICSRLTDELDGVKLSLEEMQLKYDREKNSRDSLLGEVNELRSGVIANKKQYEKKFTMLKEQLQHNQSELDIKSKRLQKIETLFATFQQLAEVTQGESKQNRSQPLSSSSSLSVDSLHSANK